MLYQCPEFERVIRSLAERYGLDIDGEQHTYIRLTLGPNTGIKDLIIETEGELGDRMMVGHYDEDNGDLVPNPMLSFYRTRDGLVPHFWESAALGSLSALTCSRKNDLGEIEIEDPGGCEQFVTYAEEYAPALESRYQDASFA